jgi:Icc-related predicted phosphoesterase
VRELRIDGLFNVRAAHGERPWIIRSGAPDRIRPTGVAALRRLGVTDVLDLREPGEAEAELAEPRVTSVPLYGTNPPATGRIEDIYEALLRDRGPALAAAVGVIADATGGTLVHCTAGKDRTGLVVALARLATGATREEVIADYARSGPNVRDHRLDHAVEIAANASVAERDDVFRLHLDSPPVAMTHALDVIDEFGGAVAYLLGNGLDETRLAALRRKAQVAPAAPAPPAAATTIVHVSDVHATDGEPLYGEIDGLARLWEVGAYLVEKHLEPAAIVITGDLIERGNTGAYPAVAQALADLERTVGAPVVVTLGNHDEPAAAADAGIAVGPRAVTVGDLRLLLLDSSRGELGAAQLEWLAAELAAEPAAGAIIALHHPPIPSPLPALANAHLRDAAALLDTLEGADTRVVLAGHFHHELVAATRGTLVSVAPALAYQQVMFDGDDRVAGFDRSAFSLVRLDGVTASVTTVPYAHPPRLFEARVSGRAESAFTPAQLTHPS